MEFYALVSLCVTVCVLKPRRLQYEHSVCWKSEHLHHAFHVIFIEKELVTPPLNGLILPGITRASILELSREWNEFRISERDVPMAEIINLLSEKRVS